MKYASYSQTRHGDKTQFGPFDAGDRIALKVVAATWENDHGKFWAAYYGDGEREHADVADHGVKLAGALAETLFPQIVAAGYEWWD